MVRRAPQPAASYRPLLIAGALAVGVVAADLAWRAHTEKPAPTVDEAPSPGSAADIVERARRLAADRYGVVDPVLVHLVLGGLDARSSVNVTSEPAQGGMTATFASRSDPSGQTALVAYGASGLSGGPMPPGLSPQVAPAECDVQRFLAVARERGATWGSAILVYGVDEAQGEEQGTWRLEESGRLVLKLGDDECVKLASAAKGGGRR